MERNIKVLVFCTVDLSIKVLLAAQIRALTEAGYDVHAACAEGKYVQSLRDDGLNIKVVKTLNRISPLANLHSLFEVYKLMRAERYDIVHVHTIGAAFTGRLAAWLARVPLIIYTFRGFAWWHDSPWWVKPFNLSIEWLCAPMTDFAFSQSEENLKRAIKHKVVDANRCLTIGNGVAIEEFLDAQTDTPEAVAALRDELNLPFGSSVVGITCRLIKEKGIIEFFEASVKVSRVYPDAVFLVVGDALVSDGKLGIRQQLQELIEKNNLAEKFFFTGFRTDATRLYKAMDIFVLPSYHEGMPRSIIEAMASGKPVVATDIAGCRDEVVKGETGLLVPPGDADALADAIMKLLADPTAARRMGEAGRRRAVEHFDERLVCERVVETYQKLVAEKFSVGARGNIGELKNAED